MADKAGVERFIFISTLKAAYPKLCFSVSYKMAELYLEEMTTRSRTRFMSVRVGNILGEETHFVKFLKNEIIEKGTVTLPVPDKGFWFLQSDRAAQLVLKAGGMGEGGEVFSLDRGRCLTIKTIAKELCDEAPRGGIFASLRQAKGRTSAIFRSYGAPLGRDLRYSPTGGAPRCGIFDPE